MMEDFYPYQYNITIIIQQTYISLHSIDILFYGFCYIYINISANKMW